MESSIKALVEDIKQEMFFNNADPYSLIAPSAYDTAWLAMVPSDSDPLRPMFPSCLNWVLTSQTEDGVWGECDGHGTPTIECLPATIACMIALKKWNVGQTMVDKGMAFIRGNNARNLIREMKVSYPRWFAIIFPGMLELALENGLEIEFPDQLKGAAMDIFYERRQILEREKLVGKHRYPPILAYFEALPFHDIDEEQVVNNLSEDGSLFQSPSATATAFMATGNKDCLAYLESLVQKFPRGVPPMYPIDEELIKLSIADQLQRLGLAEHFNSEIDQILQQVYRNYINQESGETKREINSVAEKLYKDSLAFRLLRMNGYSTSPGIFCWFLLDEEILDHITKNQELFVSVLLNVYRATHLMFPEEHELADAESFSRRFLGNSLTMETLDHYFKMVQHELRLPWLARLDHLEHRMWIEEKNINALWMGKSSFLRFSSLHNDKLMQLATKNYEFRQAIFRNELEDLKRWSKRWGLADIGFGREKTTYLYFATAATTSQPRDSDLRMFVAKSGIVITVADDFYDMEGSLHELQKLTHAVQRWDPNGLTGHGKTIFDVLDDLVREMSEKYLTQRGSEDITKRLRVIWYETFNAWLTEANWSRSGLVPSSQEYLETGMTSIAAHTIVLPNSCFLGSEFKLQANRLEEITKLVMTICRLLNDIQSYEKEQKEGKINYVLLHLKENPEAKIEDSIASVNGILEQKKREFLEQALMDGVNDLSKRCRQLHLLCLKVFQMFFHSSNRFDSGTELLRDIQKAIYLPLQVGPPKPLKLPQTLSMPQGPPPQRSGSPKKRQPVANYYHHFDRRICYVSKRINCFPRVKDRSVSVSAPLSFKLCFM